MATLYHGTSVQFANFDLSKAAPYNVGLHFGSRLAAQDRINYLREHGANGPFLILECQLDVKRPFRIDDVFGHSYAMILDALQCEISNRESLSRPSLQREISALVDEYMEIDDNAKCANDELAYRGYCQRLNNEIVRMFRELGYDSLVYKNEIEGIASGVDSYVIFDEKQTMIIGRHIIDQAA